MERHSGSRARGKRGRLKGERGVGYGGSSPRAMAAPVKILVAGLPAEIVREIGLRLRGVAITEFDNAQKMGRAAAHGVARAIILSDALPTEEAIYVARRARDSSDEMHIAF